jgi:hypothetical protein
MKRGGKRCRPKGYSRLLCIFVQIFRFFDGLALSCRFILFGLGLFVESGDLPSEVQGQF